MNAEDVTIRAARPADIDALAILLNVLFSLEVEFEPDRSKQERALQLILSDETRGHILVAEIGNSVVGMVSLLPVISTALGGPVAILEDMVVLPNVRGKGIGQKLVSGAEGFARRKGYGRITLLTDESNTRAHRFYEAQGFLRSAMVPFRLKLIP